MAVGGDIFEITDNHPSLGSFVYKVVAGEGNTYDPGGFRSNDDANMVTGGGEAIRQINNKLGSLNATIVNDMTQKVVERLKDLAGNPVPSTWTFSIVNGITYKGSGYPVGDFTPNINDSKLALKVNFSTLKQV